MKQARIEGRGDERDNRAVGAASRESFQDELRNAGRRLVLEDLDTLVESLDQAGERLKRSPVPENLAEYKELVRSFMLKCVEAMYQVDKKTGFARSGQRRMFTIVRTIDEELQRLTEMVISKQQDKMAIIAKVDEIRGLLKDFYY